MTEEEKIIEKLKRVQALFQGAKTKGEKKAALHAMNRIQGKLEQIKKDDPPVEYQFSLTNMWSRKVMIALLRKYGFSPYRYPRQRYTTVMARLPKSFADDVLWPEFQELNDILRTYLDDVTNRVISQSIHEDYSEPEIQKSLKA